MTLRSVASGRWHSAGRSLGQRFGPSTASADEQAAVRRAMPWVGATLALAFGPAMAVTPWHVSAAVLALLGLKLLAHRRGWQLGARVVLPLAAVALVAWALGFEHWTEAPAVMAFFALVLALKWLEAVPRSGRRDQIVLLLASTVLTALGVVHHVALLSLALLLAQAFALVGALAALQGAVRPMRLGAGLLGLALPVAAALFVATPRVPGPLWDFGLALGLPIGADAPRSGPGLGGRDSLEPGAPSSGGLEDGTVLVARFDGYVPAAALLYWRGPVLTRFDGQRWTPSPWWATRNDRMAAGYRRAAAWRAQLRGRGEPLRYHLRLAAHNGPWLYALDLPAGLPPESYVTRDWQLLSMTPIREEVSYQATAWLDWQMTDPVLADTDRAEALSWPAEGNPRLRALGAAVAEQHATAADRVAAGLAHFSQGGFRLDPKVAATPGPTGYDRFVFEQREGGVDQFAGAFTLLMRAAGVPARLVTGYRGGRLMGATDYVLVKQSQAHAWVETWLDGRGWVRVDPVDAVVPVRGAPRRTAIAGASAVRTPVPAATAGAAPPPATADGWPWLRLLDGWVLHYDAQRREQLLRAMVPASEASSGALWVAMLAGAAALPLLAGAWWWQRRRADRHVEPLRLAWSVFCRRLAEVGLPTSPADCPSVWQQHLAQAASAPDRPWASPAAELAAQWLALTYQPSTPAQRNALARRLRRFHPRSFQRA